MCLMMYIRLKRIFPRGWRTKAEEFVDKRDKLTRRKRWEQLDEDVTYTRNELDKKVVNPSQIRNIIRAYKTALKTSIYPDRIDQNGEYEVPKTLVFAKTDSHADDIIKIIREEFDEGNDFCKKVTYKIEEDPKSVLNRFRIPIIGDCRYCRYDRHRYRCKTFGGLTFYARRKKHQLF